MQIQDNFCEIQVPVALMKASENIVKQIQEKKALTDTKQQTFWN